MTYIKVDNELYPASIGGKMVDHDWDDRQSKAITLTMTPAAAAELFVDGLEWSIVDGEEEFDNSDYNIAGDITDHRDGTVTVKMGKPTALEEKTAMLDAAETALREGVESIG